MRVLICGDRNWSDPDPIGELLDKLCVMYEEVIVIEGEARGADTLARAAAQRRGLSVERFPALWAAHGRAAGPIRNKQMLTEGRPDLVVAFHPDIEHSRGTKNMVTQAQRAGVETRVVSA